MYITRKQIALDQLRGKLPHGDIGRIINSFIFPGHTDALDQIRRYREKIKSSITDFHIDFAEAVSTMGIIRSYIYIDTITSQFSHDIGFLYGTQQSYTGGHFLYKEWEDEILLDLSISLPQFHKKIEQLARVLNDYHQIKAQ